MSLTEIRNEIDQVDAQIRELFIRRMGLAERVAVEKAKTEDVIYKPDREQAIIEKQSKDMDPHLLMEYRALVKRIMEVSRKYQYGRTLELRNCFPYEFETEERTAEKLAVGRCDLQLCPYSCRDEIVTTDTSETALNMLISGKVDAAAGVLEEVGRGVNDKLYEVLHREHLYITDCRIVTRNGSRYKTAMIRKNFIVLPDHNRIKLVFVCPNRSGSLAGLLSMISDYGVNVTQINSLPYRTEEEWNYQFYLEIEANLLQDTTKALIYQLSCETAELQLLGSYNCEGDF